MRQTRISKRAGILTACLAAAGLAGLYFLIRPASTLADPETVHTEPPALEEPAEAFPETEPGQEEKPDPEQGGGAEAPSEEEEEADKEEKEAAPEREDDEAPDAADKPEQEKTAAEEKAEEADAAPGGPEKAEVEQTVQPGPFRTAQAAVYTDGSFTEPLEGAPEITVTGRLPEGSEILAYPAAAEAAEGEYVLFAYEISVYVPDEEGKSRLWEPPEGESLAVSVQVPQLDPGTDLAIYHIPETGEQEKLAQAEVDEAGSVQFSTDHFSVFAGTIPFSREPLLTAQTTEKLRTVGTAFSPAGTEKGQVISAGGVNRPTDETGDDAGDGIAVGKTVEETDTENVFDITLTVDAQTKVEELVRYQPMDVVIVLDISNTMRYGFNEAYQQEPDEQNRYGAALKATQAFLEAYLENDAASTADFTIGIAAFNTDAHEIVPRQPVGSRTAEEWIQLIKERIDSEMAYTAGDPRRFTNMEAGLKLASDMLEGASDNRYVIFLTDGMPTTYLRAGYTGYVPTSNSGTPFTDGVFFNGRDGVYCSFGGVNYSDKAAQRAQNQAAMAKGQQGIEIFTVSCGLRFYDKYRQAGYDCYMDGDRARMAQLIDCYPAAEPYVIGRTTDDFRSWLAESIGSGADYYFDCEDQDGQKAMLEAFRKIFVSIKTRTEEKVLASWVVEDPVTSGVDTQKENYVEFLYFYDRQGNPCQQLAGAAAQGAENTASCREGAITWDLKGSGYTPEPLEGGGSRYGYRLRYRVRLKNEAAGFVGGAPYRTNGETSLVYCVETNGDLSENKRILFPVPEVKGYLGELVFRKESAEGQGLQGAVFALRHQETCRLCRGDGTQVLLGPEEPELRNGYTAVSQGDGTVRFSGIPSGHGYQLQELSPPAGYRLSPKAYDGAVRYNNQDPEAADARSRAETALETDGETLFSREDGTLAFRNTAAPSLPETGGPGVAGLLSLGGGLCGLAMGAWWALCRRREADLKKKTAIN